MVMPQHADAAVIRSRARVPEIVIVAPSYDRFADFVRAARAGEIGLHLCLDGHSAVRLARRFPATAWIVASDLPDMSGFDLVDMLGAHDLDPAVDAPGCGARAFLDTCGESLHTAVFVVADEYRLEDEQRALAAGVAGFFVHAVTPDVIRESLQHATAAVVSGPAPA